MTSSMYVCVYMFVHMCVCACVYMYMHMYVHACVVRTCTHAHTQVTCICMYVYTNEHLAFITVSCC